MHASMHSHIQLANISKNIPTPNNFLQKITILNKIAIN